MADPCPPGRTEYGERSPQAATVMISTSPKDYKPKNDYYITVSWRLLMETHMYALTSLL